MCDRETLNLSESEKKRIFGRLSAAVETLAAKSAKGSSEYNEDIYLAANSGDKDLADLATVVAFYSVRPFFSNLARKFQNSAGKPEIDDFMNDLYVNKIFKDIREYNPEYSLIAWLNPWAVPIFQETKKKELGQSMSQYYQNVGIVVTRATRALEKAGNYNPTDLDIYEYIRDNFPKKEIGLVTVQRVRAQNFTYESLDQKSTAIADTSEFANPERAFISKEKTESFEEAKDSLSERNRLIIEMEQEYVRQQGEMPPIEYITTMLQKHDPSLTEKKVARMINSAHQELKRKYKRKKYAEAPVNNMASAEAEDSYMEEDETIIMEAIEEDISLLDI